MCRPATCRACNKATYKAAASTSNRSSRTCPRTSAALAPRRSATPVGRHWSLACSGDDQRLRARQACASTDRTISTRTPLGLRLGCARHRPTSRCRVVLPGPAGGLKSRECPHRGQSTSGRGREPGTSIPVVAGRCRRPLSMPVGAAGEAIRHEPEHRDFGHWLLSCGCFTLAGTG